MTDDITPNKTNFHSTSLEDILLQKEKNLEELNSEKKQRKKIYYCKLCSGTKTIAFKTLFSIRDHLKQSHGIALQDYRVNKHNYVEGLTADSLTKVYNFLTHFYLNISTTQHPCLENKK